MFSFYSIMYAPAQYIIISIKQSKAYMYHSFQAILVYLNANGII